LKYFLASARFSATAPHLQGRSLLVLHSVVPQLCSHFEVVRCFDPDSVIESGRVVALSKGISLLGTQFEIYLVRST
jgi:hypothetical protein